MLAELREHWDQSKIFRIVLSLAIMLALLRSVIQGAYLGLLLLPELGILGGLPEWASSEDLELPIDLQIYLNAAEKFRDRETLYQQGSLDVHEEQYPYTPLFAFVSTCFLDVSPAVLAIVDTFLHIIAYGILYVLWGQIFLKRGLSKARRMLAFTLPVWLLFTAFWSDLAYLNVYIFMALFATLLIRAILNEQLGMAVLWLTIILQLKPHWAFAAAVSLFLGRRRFFFKLTLLALTCYAIAVIILMILVEPGYIGGQYIHYYQFLRRLGHAFPWRGPDAPFLGYNHSVKQIIFYFLGVSMATRRLALLIKLLLLAPLGWIGLHHLLNPFEETGSKAIRTSLDLAFVLYLGAFIWLDVVWEVTLGIVVFTYLLGTTEQRSVRIFLWVIFLPYVLIDLWQALSLIIWGIDVIAPGPYVLTDPSLYVPIIMMTILGLYAYLISRLWPAKGLAALPLAL